MSLAKMGELDHKPFKPSHISEHWVRCPEWQKLEAAA